MNKVAFFTTDVESFFDTSCVREKGIRFDKNHDGAEGFAAYLSLLDEYDIRATLFLTVDTANRWQEILKKALTPYRRHHDGLVRLHLPVRHGQDT